MAIERPIELERTALGTAFVAGISTGIWSGNEEIAANWRVEKIFEPQMSDVYREQVRGDWKEAVTRTLSHKQLIKK